MKYFFIIFMLFSATCFSKNQYSDEQIKQQIIQQSISSYPGSCPCPYSLARNGSSCGARSAYSKPGGYDPICYPKDISPEMVKKYRMLNGLN